jgi:hypothetical protein
MRVWENWLKQANTTFGSIGINKGKFSYPEIPDNCPEKNMHLDAYFLTS